MKPLKIYKLGIHRRKKYQNTEAQRKAYADMQIESAMEFVYDSDAENEIKVWQMWSSLDNEDHKTAKINHCWITAIALSMLMMSCQADVKKEQIRDICDTSKPHMIW